MSSINFIVLISFTLCLGSVLGSKVGNFRTQPHSYMYEKAIKQCIYDQLILQCQRINNPNNCSQSLVNLGSSFKDYCGQSRFYLKFGSFDLCEEEFFKSQSNLSLTNELKQCRKQVLKEELPPQVYRQIITDKFQEHYNYYKNEKMFVSTSLEWWNSIRDGLVKCADLTLQAQYDCQEQTLQKIEDTSFTMFFESITSDAQNWHIDNPPRINRIRSAELLEAYTYFWGMYHKAESCNLTDCQYQYLNIIQTIINQCYQYYQLPSQDIFDICFNYALISNNISKDSKVYKEYLYNIYDSQSSYVNIFNRKDYWS